MTNSQSVEQDGIVAGNIFAMLDNANRGVNRMKFISLATDGVKLNAAHTWCLLRLLPLMVGMKVPENNPVWQILLMLHKIT